MISGIARILFMYFALPGLAYAYIDPGSGAYYLQVLIALTGAVMFYLTHPKELFNRIKCIFVELFRRKQK